MVDLSICLPGIRKSRWDKLYDSILASIGNYSFELIIVGPYEPDEPLASKVKFIKDFGSPSRATQIASLVCSGLLMTWTSDDGLFFPNALSKSIDLWKSVNDEKAEIVMRYNEGNNGMSSADWYWRARNHDDLKCPGVQENWLMAPLGMLKLDYFREIGGLDCKFEHINMCCHDLSFRIQKDGGKLYLSDGEVANFEHMPGRTGDHGPVHDASIDADFPLFKKLYAKPSDRIKIPYNNWVYIDPVWRRRFSVSEI